MSIDTSTPTTECPDCTGPRIAPWEAGCVAVFAHLDGCALARQEWDTFEADRARRDEYGTVLHHRPVTTAERLLLRVSGVEVPLRAAVFARVEWTGKVRRRSWTDVPLRAVDAAVRS